MAKRARLTSGRPNHRAVKSLDGHTSPKPLGMTMNGFATAGSKPLASVAPPEAVTLFERGMAALQGHDYRRAAELFDGLVDRFTEERALVERSRVYLALCQRELGRRPPAPRTIEERLTAATAALNNEDDAATETLVRAVLEESPRHELALYLLAAVEARRGARESALTLLTRALDVSPEIRAQARHDLDFETLRELEAFQQLLDAPVVPASQTVAPPQRRPRRVRAER